MAGQTPGDGGTGQTTLDQIIAPGILTALSIYTDNFLEQQFQTYVTVHIMRGGLSISNRVQAIVSGYVTEDIPLSWQGFFELTPDDFIRAHFRGNLDPVFRLNYHRLTQTSDGAVKELLRELFSPA